MTTTALTAINAGPGVRPVTVAVIEGYPYALTDHDDPSEVLAALQGSSVDGHTDITDVLNGLSVRWDQEQHADPWSPFTEPPILRMMVFPGRSSEGADGDSFGQQVGKRTAAVETFLGADFAPTEDATLVVKSTTAFDASGPLYLGPERVVYGNIGDVQSFESLTRGTCSPFGTETGGRFARLHRIHDLTTETGPIAGVKLNPRVTSEPTNWIGRWVGVWLLTPTAAGLTTLDQSHCAFAGTIAEIGEGERGETTLALEDVRRTIFQTQLMRDPFKAKLKEGVYVKAGDRFGIRTTRQVSGGGTTVGIGNDLVGTVSASGANQIEPGIYTVQELGARLLSWLQAEKIAARIILNVHYWPMLTTADGLRGYLAYDDGTSASDLMRSVVLSMPTRISEFMGWGEPGPSEIALSGTSRSGHVYSPQPPLRFSINELPGLADLALTDPSGTFEDQAALLPPALRTVGATSIDGILRIGEVFYVRVVYVSDTEFQFSSAGLDLYFPGAKRLENAYVTVDEQDSLDVTQVVLLDGAFSTVLPSLLFSTGSTGYNTSAYDSLGAGLGCAIPYGLAGDDFIADCGAVPCSDLALRIILDKPTRFVDLLQVDFLLRFCFFTFAGGRLRLDAWSTPTTTYSTINLTESNKAAPVGTQDPQIGTAVEMVEDIRNVVKINYGMGADGELMRDVTIIDAGSVRDHGSRGVTLDARNAALPDVAELLASFSGGLPLLSRPRKRITRPVNLTLFDPARPGAQALITDRHIRNPETGRRYSHMTGGGLTGWPCIITGNRHTWGGVEPGPNAPIVSDHGGEVTVLLYPRQTSAPYSPCAQFRGSNYDAGTFTASCLAHEHSASSDPVDASNFAAGDKVIVVEIDPSSAASPLHWSRTIDAVSGNDVTFTADLTPGFDSAKSYRIISDGYATAVATQQTDTYQASADSHLVASVRQPYALAYFGAGQVSAFTLADATDLPARHADLAYGDGAALDTGYERDIARGLNNALSYLAQPLTPFIYSEARTHSGVGTYELVAVFPVDIGMMHDVTQLLAVAPMFKSTDGNTANVRITLGKVWPQGSTRGDVTHVDPYRQVNFSTTSTSYAVATVQTLPTAHLNRTGDALGGRGWIAVEINNKASLLGLAHCQLGPRGESGDPPSPNLIQWHRSAHNGMHPESAFYAACVRDENRLVRDRHKCAFAKSWPLGPAVWPGVSSSTVIARFRWRTGYGVKRLRVTLVIGKTNGNGATPVTAPTIDVAVTKVGGSTTTLNHRSLISSSAVTPLDAPDEWFISNDVIDVDPASAYTVTVTTNDYARPLAISGMEMGPATADESTDYYNAFVAQADAPLLDSVRSRLLVGVSNMLRQNSGIVFHWSLQGGAARTRTSATAINLIDNATTGAPTSATPGWHYDTTYRNTSSRTTVPIEFAVYASMASGTGTVTFEDSTTTYATVSVNSATPQWWTATGSIPAGTGKIDPKFKGDGTSAISVYDVSCEGYES